MERVLGQEQQARTMAARAIPEVVAPLLQLEGVLGAAVRAPGVQVAVPVDSDSHSATLHTTHFCSPGRWA